MTWVRIDDGFSDHRKLNALGPLAPLAGWLHVCALCYCARQLTDGFVPAGQVAKLARFEALSVTLEDLVTALLRVGLWHRKRGGFQIHDFLDYNPSRKKVMTERRRNAQRQERFRGRHGKRNAVSNAPRNDAPSPTPPLTTKASAAQGSTQQTPETHRPASPPAWQEPPDDAHTEPIREILERVLPKATVQTPKKKRTHAAPDDV